MEPPFVDDTSYEADALPAKQPWQDYSSAFIQQIYYTSKSDSKLGKL